MTQEQLEELKYRVARRLNKTDAYFLLLNLLSSLHLRSAVKVIDTIDGRKVRSFVQRHRSKGV